MGYSGIGKEYTVKSCEVRSIGMMVHLEEIPEDDGGYGFHSCLFEETQEYDKKLLKKQYEDWLIGELEKAEKSIAKGDYVSWKQLRYELKHGNRKKNRRMIRMKRKQKKTNNNHK